jgi:hypothetical protein
MRLGILTLLALSSAGFAQRNLNPIGNNGDILHPGIPLTGAPAQGMRLHGGQQGGPRSGHRAFGGGGGGAVLVPYPVDGFSSGYTVHNPPPGYYDPIFGGYTPAYSSGPYYNPQPAAQPGAPTVVINQNFQTGAVHPQFRDYSNVQLPEPEVTTAPPSATAAQTAPQAAPADDQPTLFLIAMRDHTIFPALAYWVQGDTLNYITLQGAQNRVSLSLVDRDLSKQLNGERNVPFRLPAAQ